MPTIDTVVLEQQPLIVADFADLYGIRLHRTSNTDMTWVEFADLLVGLFATGESRLFRRYAPKPKDRDREG